MQGNGQPAGHHAAAATGRVGAAAAMTTGHAHNSTTASMAAAAGASTAAVGDAVNQVTENYSNLDSFLSNFNFQFRSRAGFGA